MSTTPQFKRVTPSQLEELKGLPKIWREKGYETSSIAILELLLFEVEHCRVDVARLFGLLDSVALNAIQAVEAADALNHYVVRERKG